MEFPVTVKWRKAWERATLIAACGRNQLEDVDTCPMRENNYELESALQYDVFEREPYDWEEFHAIAASLVLDGAPCEGTGDE